MGAEICRLFAIPNYRRKGARMLKEKLFGAEIERVTCDVFSKNPFVHATKFYHQFWKQNQFFCSKCRLFLVLCAILPLSVYSVRSVPRLQFPQALTHTYNYRGYFCYYFMLFWEQRKTDGKNWTFHALNRLQWKYSLNIFNYIVLQSAYKMSQEVCSNFWSLTLVWF